MHLFCIQAVITGIITIENGILMHFFFKLGFISGIITIHIFLCNIGYNVRFCNTCTHINREKNGMPVILNDITLLSNL